MHTTRSCDAELPAHQEKNDLPIDFVRRVPLCRFRLYCFLDPSSVHWTSEWKYAHKICLFACRPLLVEGEVANSGFATDGTVRYAGHSFDIDGSRVLNANTEELTERTFTEAKELGVHARSSGNLCGDLY
jgi:hypothetical protein